MTNRRATFDEQTAAPQSGMPGNRRASFMEIIRRRLARNIARIRSLTPEGRKALLEQELANEMAALAVAQDPFADEALEAALAAPDPRPADDDETAAPLHGMPDE